ncbi:hypothetical protein OUZ56_027042 [Daphnia magna]|uniref:Uncharacterized protein n=1 Tax=Daphnia magna TaxID=35525 RepID=A0ABQ9ZNK5_9CRUS|nr:hypothetical protein OUZ56_027042 [Daphnia magna]
MPSKVGNFCIALKTTQVRINFIPEDKASRFLLSIDVQRLTTQDNKQTRDASRNEIQHPSTAAAHPSLIYHSWILGCTHTKYWQLQQCGAC